MSLADTLPIIKQSKTWLIIDKPSGVSVHNEINDVVNLLKKQLPSGSYKNIHPVHRLDKETSGLLLVALEKEMAATLAEQFQSRQSEKFYYAVLRGSMDVSEDWQEWTFPITDKAEGRKNPQGLSKDRVEAKSLYRVKKSNKFFSLVEVKLLTGRQHQIRKHGAIANHAIVGDSRYGDPKYNKKMAAIYGTDRMFLHAFRLSIVIEGKTETFEASLPQEFEKLLN
ncbi:MAG: RluA family pseudouridine synthase [Bdellovibrio sp.]